MKNRMKPKIKYVGYVLGKQHFLLSEVDLNKQPEFFSGRYPFPKGLSAVDLVYTLNQHILVGSRANEDDENKFEFIADKIEKDRWDFHPYDVFETREEAIANILKKKKQLFDIVFSGNFL